MSNWKPDSLNYILCEIVLRLTKTTAVAGLRMEVQLFMKLS